VDVSVLSAGSAASFELSGFGSDTASVLLSDAAATGAFSLAPRSVGVTDAALSALPSEVVSFLFSAA
jgi:hypothetical protein